MDPAQWKEHSQSSLGEKEIMREIKELQRRVKKRLVIYSVNVLSYRSIVEALRGCSGLFLSLENPDGYDLIPSREAQANSKGGRI